MTGASIKLEKVSFSYTTHEPVLQAISLDLAAGCVYGLVGMNGAGKSTLFKAIMGLIAPQQGSIRIDEMPVKKALKQNRIAYVPQTEEIDWNFPVLVEDVVMMGRYGYMNWLRIPKPCDYEAVNQALQQVQLNPLRKRHISELSGGQKKRMFVARALAQNSQIILLDEPFSGVDINTETRLMNLFQHLANTGHLLLVSTHNLGSVPAFCDQVVLLKNKIIAEGKTPHVLTEKNLEVVFGGALRHLTMTGGDLHEDADERGVTVLTDDERPLVLYGKQRRKKRIFSKK